MVLLQEATQNKAVIARYPQQETIGNVRTSPRPGMSITPVAVPREPLPPHDGSSISRMTAQILCTGDAVRGCVWLTCRMSRARQRSSRVGSIRMLAGSTLKSLRLSTLDSGHALPDPTFQQGRDVFAV